MTVVVGSMLALSGCGARSLDAPNTKRPSILGSKCDLAEKQSAPLIVDWDASKRSRLESAVHKGAAIAVHVDACSITPLWQCELPAKYAYEGSTLRRDAERIADAGSLYARIPTSAASLEARISAGSELEVKKATVGRFALDTLGLAENQLRGQCNGATHFVSAVDVGAFEFSAKKRVEAGAEVKVGAAGGGVSKSAEHELLSSDGDLDRCEGGGAPSDGCGAPIQIDLTPFVPSLTKEEFLAFAIGATQQAFKTCFLEKKLVEPLSMRLLYAVANPDGTVSLRTPNGGPIEPVYFDCLSGFWTSKRLAAFGGPPIVLQAMAYELSVQPYEDLAKVMAKIEQFYVNNSSQPDPGIPPLEVGQQVSYDYGRYGVTATDRWQYPWRW